MRDLMNRPSLIVAAPANVKVNFLTLLEGGRAFITMGSPRHTHLEHVTRSMNAKSWTSEVQTSNHQQLRKGPWDSFGNLYTNNICNLTKHDSLNLMKLSYMNLKSP